MKAANGLNWGEVESPDFPCCVLMFKDKELYILSADVGGNVDYTIKQENVIVFQLVGCGGEWAKYRLLFKDGKTAIITQPVYTQQQRNRLGISVHIAPLERFFRETNNQQIIQQNNLVEDTMSPGFVSEEKNEEPEASIVEQLLNED